MNPPFPDSQASAFAPKGRKYRPQSLLSNQIQLVPLTGFGAAESTRSPVLGHIVPCESRQFSEAWAAPGSESHSLANSNSNNQLSQPLLWARPEPGLICIVRSVIPASSSSVPGRWVFSFLLIVVIPQRGVESSEVSAGEGRGLF